MSDIARPVEGQILTTKSGHKFVVRQIVDTHEPDDPDSNPAEFAVILETTDGIELWDLIYQEFQEWCKYEGIVY